MGFAELIDTLNTLPPEKQAEIIDFAEFVAKKHQQVLTVKNIKDSLVNAALCSIDLVNKAEQSESLKANERRPHPAIAGKTVFLGDIVDSVSPSAWDFSL